MKSILRVGLGYDLHRLVEDRKLILAGVPVIYEKGLAGHSDADVVLHAVTDALLGAAGLGDIGEQFPDTDPAFKDVDSALLLEKSLELVKEQGFVPVNVDLSIIAEKPKLSPYKMAMRENLARLLDLEINAVSVKAKTNEGLGETGNGLAIACHCIASLGMAI